MVKHEAGNHYISTSIQIYVTWANFVSTIHCRQLVAAIANFRLFICHIYLDKWWFILFLHASYVRSK